MRVLSLAILSRLFLMVIIGGLPSVLFSQQEVKNREIYVPFDDLQTILASGIQRIYLPRGEYEELLKKAEFKPGEAPPQETVLRSAKYRIAIQGDSAIITGDLEVESLSPGLQQLPLGFAGVSLLQVMNGQQTATLVRDSDVGIRLLIAKPGKHQYQFSMSAPVQHAAAKQSLSILLPHAANSTIDLTVPGNIEIKSGASVLERTVDVATNQTAFKLLAKPGPLVLSMSLNNKLLKSERIVVARNVLVAELTQAIERLHGTFSMQIVQGAASEFRYRVPDQFEVTNVTAPGVSRWSVAKENDEQILTVDMRVPQIENLLVHITALRSAPATGSWEFPAIQPLDVLVSTGVVGILADRRLAVNSLETTGVISLDTAVLQRALPASIFVVEPGAPLIRVLATYYVPQTDYSIKADIAQPENRTHVQTSTLLSLNQSNHTVAVRFSIFSELDDLYTVTIQAPGPWNITGLHDDTGAALGYHETIDEMGIRRLHAKFPGRKAFGRLHSVLLTAERVPPGWLNQWQEFHLAVPKFMLEDTFRDEGVIAIRTQSGFEQVYEIRAEQVSGVETLATAEKQEAGLSGRLALAFRYEKPQYTVAVVARRVKPVMAARLATFLNVQVGVLHTYSEINYTVQQSLVEKVQFVLPTSSPSDLNVVGLGVTQIKQFVSEEQDGKRIWTVTLNKPTAGNIIIGIDYEQVLEETESKYVPALVVAGNVVYQSGVLSIESSPELAIGVESVAKPVDVGELVVLGYSVGKHRVGAFGYTGAEPVVTLTIDRPKLFAVPSSLIQRGEIVSFVSSHGVYQSVARFELLSKASYLQVQLPANGKLWSVVLDGTHTLKPQKVGGIEGRFLVALTVDDQQGAWLRDLRVVYEQKVTDGSGEFSLEAPTLYEFNGGQVTPQQDVKLEAGKMRWQLIVPGSYVIQPSANSSMRLIRQPEQVPQVAYAAGTVWIASGGVLLNASLADSAVASTSEMAPGYDFDAMAYEGEEGAEDASSFSGPMSESVTLESRDESRRIAELSDSDEAITTADMPALTPAPVSPQTPTPGEDLMPESSRPPLVTAQPQSPDSGDQLSANLPNTRNSDYAEEGQIAGDSYKNSQIWALQGMKSLNVDLLDKSRDAQGDIDVEWMDFVRYDFQSLGGNPRLSGKVVRKSFVTIWAWVIGLAVLIVGLALTSLPTKTKRNYVFGLLAVLALASAIPAFAFYRPITEVSFVMILVIAVFYLFHHLLQSGWQWFRQAALSKIGLGLWILACITCLPTAVWSQEPVEITPVEVPRDAVIVPYDPDQLPLKRTASQQLLIPLAHYSQLWRRAYPELPLEHELVPVEFAFSGVQYETSLNADNGIFIEGVIGFDVFTSREVAVPLALNDLVLEYATLDKQPAQIDVVAVTAPNAAGQQAALPARPTIRIPATHTLYVKGKGHHELRVGLRMQVQRQGGWRLARGKLPIGAHGVFTLIVPQKDTEIRWQGHLGRAEMRTENPNQSVASSLKLDGGFDFRWRPLVEQSRADRDLTAESQILVDVQEDGVYVDWRVQLDFRNSQRELFRFVIPQEYRLASVTGENIRSWESKEIAQGAQEITVELLEPAENQVVLAVHLLRYRGLPEEEGDPFTVPAVSVPDAVSQKGTIMIRRSPALELFVNTRQGVNRDDINDTLAQTAQPASRVNPLGVQAVQAYRFSAAGYELKLLAKPVLAIVTANIQSLVRVSPQQISLETQVQLRVENRPVHQVRIIVPLDLSIRQIQAANMVEWSVAEIDSIVGPAQQVTILLAQGVTGNLNVLIEGQLQRKLEDLATDVPYLAVPDVRSQRGQTVLLSDPSFNIELLDIDQGESVSMATMFAWLQSDQRAMARTALKFSGQKYSARFKLVPRTPQVSCTTFSNVNVTDRSIEETILLSYVIEDAGIQSISFLIPADMSTARIRGPYVRQMTKEPLDSNDPQSLIRVTLHLEDELIGQYRVLVENDRQPGGSNQVPIPIVENATVSQQFISLESSGDVIQEVAESRVNVVRLNRQQAQWIQLANVIGDRVREAFLIKGDVKQAVLEFMIQQRDVIDKDDAKIRMATTSLIVDYAGTYRGKLELLVDNQKEQFLDIILPSEAHLWAVMVAGEPVKPIGMANQSTVKIPLVKTNAGDLSYQVVIHYAGRVGRLTSYGQVNSLPIVRTSNIIADKIFLKLYLPKEQQWFSFDGNAEPLNVGQSNQWGWFAAVPPDGSYAELATRQALIVNEEVSGKLKRATKSNNEYEKIRLFNSLRTQTDLNTYASQSKISQNNEKGLKELAKQVDELVDDTTTNESEVELYLPGNRSRLTQGFDEQDNGFSRNAVNQLGSNFAVPSAVAEPGSNKQQQEAKWLSSNNLSISNPDDEKNPDANGRLYQGGKGIKRETLDSLQNSKVPAFKPAGREDDSLGPQQTEEDFSESPRQQQRRQLQKYQFQQQLELDQRNLRLGGVMDNTESHLQSRSNISGDSERERALFGALGMGSGGTGGGGFGADEGESPGGASGMMGMGDGDGLLALGRGERQAAQTVDSGLASIAGFDFDFDSAETQGQYERFDFEYLDDNYEFSVRYIGYELRETMLRIGIALGALLGLCVLYWILRVVGKSRTLSTLLATLLLFVSVAMVAVGVFPILGLLVLAAAVLWILKSWIPTGAAA